MKITIIDDDIDFASKISDKLKEELKNCVIEVKTSFFYDYDANIYFLDIDMPQINGIDLAKKIKSVNEEAMIIYISYREDLVFEAIQTFPYYFLRKRYIDQEWNVLVKKLKKEFPVYSIDIIYKNQPLSIDVNDIIYIEKEGQYCQVTTRQYQYKIKQTMKYFIEHLPDFMFGIVSQSVIVNLKYVKDENSETVIMNNQKQFYYSRGKRKSFLQKYLKQMI